MRIISKYRDYYDSVQAHGSDPSIVYRRTPAELKVNTRQLTLEPFEKLYKQRPYLRPWRTHLAILGFCGKMFPFYVFEGKPYSTGEELRDSIRSQARLHPEVRAYRESLEELVGTSRWQKIPGHRRLTQFIEQFSAAQCDDEFFVRFQAPVFLIERIGFPEDGDFKVTTNPRLADYKFMRLYDPFACHQEIAMYLGNQLAQPDIAPQSVGDDETIARAKGFDEKSFRTKAPGRKKLSRKANRARKKGS